MSEDFYFVEKILSHKIQKGKKYYLIKWQGYEENENSWEPKENLNEELIKAYEQQFSSENDASLANSTKSPRSARKLKGSFKRKTLPQVLNNSVKEEKVDVVETPKENEKEISSSKPEDEPSTSKQDSDASNKKAEEVDEDDLANICTQPTLEMPPQKQRVEKIIGYSNIKFKEGKTHLLVKFSNSNQAKFVLHETFRYEYPQELIDFYEKNTQWFDFKRKCDA